MKSVDDAHRNVAKWARQPERGSLSVLRFMAWLSLHLGRPATRLLLHPITAYYLVCAPTARRASAAYLARVTGARANLRQCYRHIHTFATTIHDRVYFLSDHFHLFDIEVVGEAALRAASAEGRGTLLFGAHLGSFEVLRALGRERGGLTMSMLMYEENAQKVHALFAAINPALTHEIIPLGRLDSMLRVQETLAAGDYVGILADRELGPGGAWTARFLGGEVRMPLGPFRMAALMRRPTFFMTGLHLGGNRYQIHFVPLEDFSAASSANRAAAIESARERYVQLLEEHCHLAPYNWFNFFDFWATPASPS